MLNLVKGYLKSKDWQFSELQDKKIVLFGISGENGNFQCIADVNEDEKKFIFYSVCGANAPIEKRSEVLDLLNRLNYNFFLGHFEMDSDDGEIRYKASLLYGFITPNDDIIEQIMMTSIITMDSNLPAIMGVMFGGLTPTQAIEAIEKADTTNS